MIREIGKYWWIRIHHLFLSHLSVWDNTKGGALARGIRSAAKEKNYPANCSPVCTPQVGGIQEAIFEEKSSGFFQQKK